MKEDFVTLEVAAGLLGISCRQLQRMVKQGILKPDPRMSRSTRTSRLFRVTDIAALQEIRSRGNNPEAAFVEARQAAMEARALRLEVDNMRKALGLDMPTLATDRDTIISLLLRAEDALRDLPTQDPGELLEWARVFHSLTEAHFESITFHSDQKQPWRAFLNLGRHLLAGEQPMVTRYDFNLQGIYQMLAAGLRHTRHAAYFHIQTLYGKEYAAKVLPDVKGCPHEDVIAMSMSGVTIETPNLTN